MATAYKVLGQSNPAATTDTNLYTVPAATQTVISTVSVCNRSASAAAFRIAVRPAGAVLANQHYLAFDVTVNAKSTISWTIGITLASTDIVTVRASTADLTFSAFGSEIS